MRADIEAALPRDVVVTDWTDGIGCHLVCVVWRVRMEEVDREKHPCIRGIVGFAMVDNTCVWIGDSLV